MRLFRSRLARQRLVDVSDMINKLRLFDMNIIHILAVRCVALGSVISLFLFMLDRRYQKVVDAVGTFY